VGTNTQSLLAVADAVAAVDVRRQNVAAACERDRLQVAVEALQRPSVAGARATVKVAVVAHGQIDAVERLAGAHQHAAPARSLVGAIREVAAVGRVALVPLGVDRDAIEVLLSAIPRPELTRNHLERPAFIFHAEQLPAPADPENWPAADSSQAAGVT